MIYKLINYRTNSIVTLFTLFIICSAFAQNKKENSGNNRNLFESIISQYHPNIIGVSKTGVLKGAETMKTNLLNLYEDQNKLVSYKSHFTIPVYQVLEYEIGSSRTENNKQFAHLIIWSKEDSIKQRIAEVILEKSIKELEIPGELAKARKKWMKLCNTHKSEKLVKELYTENAIYFNRGRVISGHGQIAREYTYMDSPSYKLKLNPEHIEMVSENTIFEIGSCSGSYPLPYVLVWNKQPDGAWKIYFDSNY